MMRNNGFLKWSLHKNNSKIGSNGKNWLHPSETLTSGHIAYLVKFLGVTEADQPKGIEVVKDCIRKLKLDEEIRRAEGSKTPKAEVTISINGVAVQEPKGKKVLHQFPLHQISYCADDKAEKKFFSFIAKDGEIHKCFVFASEKLAEEITLTIGQAFDLAYRRFLDSSGRELELKREIMLLQKKVSELESENGDLKRKLNNNSTSSSTSPTDYEYETNSSFSSSSQQPPQNNLNGHNGHGHDENLLICPPIPPRESANVANQIMAEFAMAANEIEKRNNNNNNKPSMDVFFTDLEIDNSAPTKNPEAPPRLSPPPKGGKKADNLLTNGGMTNGHGHGLLSPMPTANNSTNSANNNDIFGSDPFFTSSDPFGMSDFTPTNTANSANNILDTQQQQSNGFSKQNGQSMTNGFSNNMSQHPFTNGLMNGGGLMSSQIMSNNGPNGFSINNGNGTGGKNIESALESLDRKIEEMKAGFSRGIFTEDFPLDQLDPLKQNS